MTTRIRDHGHGTHALYADDRRLLGDDAPEFGPADGFTLDGKRQCGICEQRKGEAEYADMRDMGIYRQCWQDHDEMIDHKEEV